MAKFNAIISRLVLASVFLVTACAKKSKSDKQETIDAQLLEGAWRLEKIYSTEKPEDNIKGEKDDLFVFVDGLFSHFDVNSKSFEGDGCRKERKFSVSGKNVILEETKTCQALVLNVHALAADNLEVTTTLADHFASYKKIDAGLAGKLMSEKDPANPSDDSIPAEAKAPTVSPSTSPGAPTGLTPDPMKIPSRIRDLMETFSIQLLAKIVDAKFGDAACDSSICLDHFGRTMLHEGKQFDPFGGDDFAEYCTLELHQTGSSFADITGLTTLPSDLILKAGDKRIEDSSSINDRLTEVSSYRWFLRGSDDKTGGEVFCKSKDNILGQDAVKFMQEAIEKHASKFVKISTH